MNQEASLEALFDLIASLRADSGCPWDRKQTARSLSIYLIEEVYELVEAISGGHTESILEELGDVLFQLVFIIRIFEEQRQFSFQDVLARNIEKMIRRHPHVFGTDKVATAAEVKERWRKIKQQEKGTPDSLMDSVPAGMPALMRAYRISERAAASGFDWDSLGDVVRQAEAELDEFKDEVARNPTARSARVELGDVLFTLVNVGRLARIHPETALTESTRKFIQRFKSMEAAAKRQNRRLDQLPREEMERLWESAKREG